MCAYPAHFTTSNSRSEPADLRRYCSLAGLVSNFVITDRDDCLKTLQRILKATHGSLAKELKHTTVCDVISKCKSQNQSPAEYRRTLESVVDPTVRNRMELLADTYECVGRL